MGGHGLREGDDIERASWSGGVGSRGRAYAAGPETREKRGTVVRDKVGGRHWGSSGATGGLRRE